MKIRYYVLIIFVSLLVPVFFPKLIIVHYNNPSDPVVVYLQQYNNKSVTKEVSSGSKIFFLEKGYTMWSNDFAFLGWYKKKEKNYRDRFDGSLSFLGEKEDDLDLTVCRVHIYLDENAREIKREVKYPIFLNLCL